LSTPEYVGKLGKLDDVAVFCPFKEYVPFTPGVMVAAAL
jgi:hypothetical protein